MSSAVSSETMAVRDQQRLYRNQEKLAGLLEKQRAISDEDRTHLSGCVDKVLEMEEQLASVRPKVENMSSDVQKLDGMLNGTIKNVSDVRRITEQLERSVTAFDESRAQLDSALVLVGSLKKMVVGFSDRCSENESKSGEIEEKLQTMVSTVKVHEDMWLGLQAEARNHRNDFKSIEPIVLGMRGQLNTAEELVNRVRAEQQELDGNQEYHGDRISMLFRMVEDQKHGKVPFWWKIVIISLLCHVVFDWVMWFGFRIQ